MLLRAQDEHLTTARTRHFREVLSMRIQKAQFFFILLLVQYLCCSIHAFVGRVGILVPLTAVEGNSIEANSFQTAACGLMAVRHVNQRSTSFFPELAAQLPDGFQLEGYLMDTQSTPGGAVSGATTLINNRSVDLLLGPWYSWESSTVAIIAGMSKTPVISYSATRSELTDESLFPWFSRVSVNDDHTAFALMHLFYELNWRRIAVLFHDDAVSFLTLFPLLSCT